MSDRLALPLDLRSQRPDPGLFGLPMIPDPGSLLSKLAVSDGTKGSTGPWSERTDSNPARPERLNRRSEVQKFRRSEGHEVNRKGQGLTTTGASVPDTIVLMTDNELLHRFEAADLAEFRHADHVRTAWAYLERDGPETALARLLEGLRRFANAKGAPGKFHYTVTRAWLDLIVDARARFPDARTAAALMDACPLLGDVRALDRFYTPETITSDTARASWVEPDRAPISAAAPSTPAMPAPNPDPFAQFAAAVEHAQRLGIDTTPMALATADDEGSPSVRMVLLRGADSRGFVFHTNYTSRKARELTKNPAGGPVPALADDRGAGPDRGHRGTAAVRRIGRVLRQPAAREPNRRLGLRAERDPAGARHPRRTDPRRRSPLRRRACSTPAILGRIPRRSESPGVLVRSQ